MTTITDTAAVDELAKRIRAADGDPEFIAAEFLAWLRSRGWRPTEARPMPVWQRPHGTGTPPTEGYLAVRAELDARREEAS